MESVLKTWVQYHRRWFGDSVPFFPTRAAAIEAVAAAMARVEKELAMMVA